jgi:hypothetical protein
MMLRPQMVPFFQYTRNVGVALPGTDTRLFPESAIWAAILAFMESSLNQAGLAAGNRCSPDTEGSVGVAAHFSFP